MPTELLRPGRRYLIEIPAGQVQAGRPRLDPQIDDSK